RARQELRFRRRQPQPAGRAAGIRRLGDLAPELVYNSMSWRAARLARRLVWPALGLLLGGLLAACAGAIAETALPATNTPEPTPTANIVVELVTSPPEAQPSATPFEFPQTIGIGGHLSASGSYTQT